MRLRNLFTPSFRNRLRLFFMLIVVIPMIAVAAVLFQIVSRSEETQTDAQLAEAQRVARNLYRQSEAKANAAGRRIVNDQALREAIADEDAPRIEKRLGRIITSVDTAMSFATQLDDVAEVGAVIKQGDQVLGASRPELARAAL